jgi:hypothetical protein
MWWRCLTLPNCCATIILQQFDESSCNEAQYVAKQNKIGLRKVKTYYLRSAKWFWPNIFSQNAELGKRHSTA